MSLPADPVPALVVPCLLDLVGRSLTADERARLGLAAPTDTPPHPGLTTLGAERARLAACAGFTALFAARLLRGADCEDWAGLVALDAQAMTDDGHAPTTVFLAAVYRSVIARLPQVGAVLHGPTLAATRALRWSIVASEGLHHGSPRAVVAALWELMVGARGTLGRPTWLRWVGELVAALGRTDVAQPSLDLREP